MRLIVSDSECGLPVILITDGSSKYKCSRLIGKRERERELHVGYDDSPNVDNSTVTY